MLELLEQIKADADKFFAEADKFVAKQKELLLKKKAILEKHPLVIFDVENNRFDEIFRDCGFKRG